MPKKYLYLSLLIVGTAFWGVSFAVVKNGMSYADPYSLLVYKFGGAALALALLFFQQIRKLRGRTVAVGLLLAGPLFAGTLLQTIGLQHTTAANAAFITGLDVLLIPLFKALVYRQRIAPKTWLACALAFAGLYVVAIRAGFHLQAGDGWMIACAFGFAWYVLLVGRYAREPLPMAMLVVQLLVCGLLSGLAGAVAGQPLVVPTASAFWLAIGFTSLLATAYMYGVQNYAQRYLPEEKIALTYLFEPLFATLAGAVLLHEAITPRTVLGGLLILSAMLLTEVDVWAWLGRRRRAAKRPAAGSRAG